MHFVDSTDATYCLGTEVSNFLLFWTDTVFAKDN